MSEAQRNNHGKDDWSLLDCSFPEAQRAELDARMYGVKKYTDELTGQDGKTNWLGSLGTEKHEEFMWGCLESANRHLREMRVNRHMMDLESGHYHAGFVRLNMGMFQKYFENIHLLESKDS